jgi:phosphoesterase RecJ-like protein
LVASELVDAGAKPKEISDKIFSSYSSNAIKLLGHILENLELYDEGKICVLKLAMDDLIKYNVKAEDTEGMIDYSMIISGVKIGILFKEHDSQIVKVSLRSQDSIDVCSYAKRKGGGGHPNAAGFTVTKRFNETIESVIAEISEYLSG